MIRTLNEQTTVLMVTMIDRCSMCKERHHKGRQDHEGKDIIFHLLFRSIRSIFSDPRWPSSIVIGVVAIA